MRMHDAFNLAAKRRHGVITGIYCKILCRVIGDISAAPIRPINDHTARLVWPLLLCVPLKVKPEALHLEILQTATGQQGIVVRSWCNAYRIDHWRHLLRGH